MIRTVVIGTTADGYRQTVGSVIRLYQQIRCRLGATIRGTGMNRRLLREEQIRTIQRQVAIDLIGGNMIKEALSKDEDECNDSVDFKTMIVLAIATSIDALAVGISLSFLNVNIWTSVLCIGVTTFAFSVGGMKIGSLFGNKHKNKAEFVGGVILILLGVKIVLEHTGVLVL